MTKLTLETTAPFQGLPELVAFDEGLFEVEAPPDGVRYEKATFPVFIPKCECERVMREIRAYELIEGRDGELTTLFATLCGLKLAANRLHSSSSSMYTSQWAARNNNQQLRLALARVVRRACTYSMNGVGMGVSRLQHFR